MLTDYSVRYIEATDALSAIQAYWNAPVADDAPHPSVTDILSVAVGIEPREQVSGDATGLLEDAKRLLANCFTPEPWQVVGADGTWLDEEMGDIPEPDTFEGYRILHDDGAPGDMFVCSGFNQGPDEGLNEAKFVARAPELVRRLVAELEINLKRVAVAEAFLGGAIEEIEERQDI